MRRALRPVPAYGKHVMNRILLGLALGTVAMLPAFAQTTTTSPATNPPAVTTPGMTMPGVGRDSGTGTNSSTPAVQTDSSRRNTSAPVPGANSFTEGQARSRMEEAGYSNLTGLHKDDQGVWRGRGMHAGRSSDVSLDYQGNVTGR